MDLVTIGNSIGTPVIAVCWCMSIGLLARSSQVMTTIHGCPCSGECKLVHAPFGSYFPPELKRGVSRLS